MKAVTILAILYAFVAIVVAIWLVVIVVLITKHF